MEENTNNLTELKGASEKMNEEMNEGKSFSPIIPYILQSILRQESFCVTDPKGEIKSLDLNEVMRKA